MPIPISECGRDRYFAFLRRVEAAEALFWKPVVHSSARAVNGYRHAFFGTRGFLVEDNLRSCGILRFIMDEVANTGCQGRIQRRLDARSSVFCIPGDAWRRFW